jgi:hypothetical protein
MDRNRPIAAARIALAAALFVAAQRAPDAGAEHLYVQVAQSSFSGSTYRYPLHDGVPASKPDFVYTASLYSPFWVDPGGNLYGFTFQGVTPYLEVFAPSHKTPARTIQLPAPQFISVYVGVVSKGGYVLAEFQGLDSALPLARSAGSCGSLGFSSVLVYGPGARGTDPPLQCFGVPSDSSVVALGLALDPKGSLYVPDIDGVAVYTRPIGYPQLSRFVAGRSFQNVYAVAVDSQGELYALSRNDYSFVAAYAAYTNGDTLPQRTFAYPTPMKWGGNVAVDDGFVYVGASGEVLVYDKSAHGRTAPHATLQVAGGSSGSAVYVELGP